ncbi:hypothetical protein D1AOALGA4SA_418 [Olavius algarvensis Delta 1 endosymbiont]|nr:hypothetical protein D1AOALGA4SA_418 [Olavius algarvensis Delta 1 endosymbiont]
MVSYSLFVICYWFERIQIDFFIPLSKTWSSGPGQRHLALPWDNSNSGFR